MSAQKLCICGHSPQDQRDRHAAILASPLNSAADAAVSALRSIAGLEADVAAAAAAVSAAAAASSSAFLAAEEGRAALSCARFRRAERLLEAVRGAVDAVQCAVRRAQDAVHVGPGLRREHSEATWRSYSDDWWEEKCLGLRWRLGDLADELQTIVSVRGDQATGASSHVCYVSDVLERVLRVQAALKGLKKWTDEWAAVAQLCESGLVGETDVYAPCGSV